MCRNSVFLFQGVKLFTGEKSLYGIGTFKLDPSKNEERELEKEEGDENGDKSQADVASDQEVSGRSSRSRQRSKKPPRPEDLPTALEEEEEIPKHKRVRPRGKVANGS